MKVKALRIIYMFKHYNIWRREKIEEILLRRKIRSIYIEKYIETLSNNEKSAKNNIIDICRGLTRYTDISLQ